MADPPRTNPGHTPLPRGTGENTDSDHALVQAAQRQDPGAWSALLTRHQDRLFAVCVRMVGSRELAADLCQEAMVRIIQGLPGFDGASQFTTWATRVTMNVCLTHLRSAKLRRHASLDGPAGRDGRSIAGRIGPSKAAEAERSDSDRFDALQVQEPNPGQRVQQQDERARLLAALAKLEPEHRAILVLRDVQGLDYDHIAHALDIPGGTVKSRLFRARAALRSLIEPPPPPQTSA